MIVLLIVSRGTLFTAALLTFSLSPGSFQKARGFIFNDCAVRAGPRVCGGSLRKCAHARVLVCVLKEHK